jgi:hypothetical protein
MNTTASTGDLRDFALFTSQETISQADSFTVTADLASVPTLSFEIIGIEGVEKTENAGLAEALRRLDEIAHIERNWDSYDSESPTAEAVSLGRELVQRVYKLASDSAVPFSIAPLSGRGVQIEWRRGLNAIEVEIDNRGKLGYLLIRETDQGRAFEERDDVPDDQLLALISSVVSR